MAVSPYGDEFQRMLIEVSACRFILVVEKILYLVKEGL